MTTMRAFPDSRATDPLAVSQIFCRLMLQISLVAIPVYLGLFMVAVPFDVDIGKLKGVALSFPVFIFLSSAIVYGVGFLMVGADSKREPFDAIAVSPYRILRLKRKIILLGSALFILGVTVGSLLLIKAHL